ncbi:unnamed protein product [Ectocarpus sp. 12 AP-2014]
MRVFNETQRFTQWWIGIIYLLLTIFPLVAAYKWFILKEHIGNVGTQDWDGIIFTLTLFPLILLLLLSFKLQVVIDERGILYRFFPFHKNLKLIPWDTMEKCYTRKYKPLTEYGGWGLKFGLNGVRALTVKGNEGIQIKLKNENSLLIGTQKLNQAQTIINRYFKKDEGVQSS